MVDFAILQTRVTRGGSNEGFARKAAETARCEATRKKGQREFKEKLLEVCVPAALLFWPPSSLPTIRIAMSPIWAGGQFRWNALVTGFQDPLNTASSGGERMIHLLAPEVNLGFLFVDRDMHY